MEAIIAAGLSSLITLVGTVITVVAASRSTRKQVSDSVNTQIAVMQNEMKNLRKEVEKHNNFAVRVPALEQQIEDLDSKIDLFIKGV